jgi:hypothetical protein
MPDEESTMIADSFDFRTLANMEVAVERACKSLSISADDHSVRRHIASNILQCVQSGNKTLGALTNAGRIATTELCAARGV